MNTNDLSKFKRLVKAGNTPDQIMEKMAICERSYYNYLKEARTDRRRKEIDMQRYFVLVRQGYTTKDELAERLGVSKKTLIKWEKSNHTDAVICRGMYVHGAGAFLSGMLHIPGEEVKQWTNGLPSIRGVHRNLQIIIRELQPLAELDPEIKTTFRTIARAAELLEEVKKSSGYNL